MSTSHTEQETLHVHLVGGPLDGQCAELPALCSCCDEPFELGCVFVDDESGEAYRIEQVVLAKAVHVGRVT